MAVTHGLLSRGSFDIESHDHHGASIVSAKIVFDDVQKLPNSSVPLERVASLMKELACEVEKRGALIGHIKACVSKGGSFARFSLVEAEGTLDIQGNLDMAFSLGSELHMAAIVFGLPESVLISLVRDVVEGLLE